MTKSHTEEDKVLPKTPLELAGYSIREFGFAAVLAIFIYIQWQADQARTARMESIMVSNAEVLRSNSAVMEQLKSAWDKHDARAQSFIEKTQTQLDEIRKQTEQHL